MRGAGNTEEYIPYWLQLWPSALVLADELAARRVADGSLTLPTMDSRDARDDMVVSASRTRSRPLQKKLDGAERVDVVDKSGDE